jgi:hypothetical protein
MQLLQLQPVEQNMQEGVGACAQREWQFSLLIRKL